MVMDTDAFSFGRAMMQDIMQALPGIDEAMSYSEVMKFVHIFNRLQLMLPQINPV